MENLEHRTQWHRWLRCVEDELISLGMNDVSKGWRDPDIPLNREHEIVARSYLRGRCGTFARLIVDETRTVRAALVALEKQYKPDNMFDVASTCRRLDSLRPSDFPDLTTYYLKFWDIQQELRDMAPELALPEPYLVAKFLDTLDAEYEDFWYTFMMKSGAVDKPDSHAVTLSDLHREVSNLDMFVKNRKRERLSG